MLDREAVEDIRRSAGGWSCDLREFCRRRV